MASATGDTPSRLPGDALAWVVGRNPTTTTLPPRPQSSIVASLRFYLPWARIIERNHTPLPINQDTISRPGETKTPSTDNDRSTETELLKQENEILRKRLEFAESAKSKKDLEIEDLLRQLADQKGQTPLIRKKKPKGVQCNGLNEGCISLKDNTIRRRCLL